MTKQQRALIVRRYNRWLRLTVIQRLNNTRETLQAAEQEWFKTISAAREAGMWRWPDREEEARRWTDLTADLGRELGLFVPEDLDWIYENQ